ncbi:MAG: MerR family transcriptional regulator [Thomasclavelia ramosa]
MGYTIREVSEILKIPVSTIRYYENLGLLPVIQRIEGKRVFTNENITDLKRIKKLKDMGMTLKDIKNFNQLYSKGKLSFEQKIMILDSTTYCNY